VADRLWGALRAHPAATPAELATSARLPRATVTALLATWLAEGSVTSTAGTTARAARRWTAVRTTLPATPDHSPDSNPRHDNPANPDPTSPDSMAAGPAADVAGAGPAATDTATPDATTSGASSTAGAPDGSAPRPSARRSVPTRNPSGSQRLPGGALRGMVEDHLRDHPDTEWGPVAIGKILHRSSGAVANALENLVTQAVAQRTGDRPKRYRLADQPESHPTTTDQTDAATTPAAESATTAGPTSAVGPTSTDTGAG
jgi:hypothetical protein